MKNHYFRISSIIFLLSILIFPDCMAESGVYVGGHIRRERPNTITKLKESGFTYVILFNVNVESDGTLKTDGETICSNGQYVFGNTQPNYIDDIKSLKTAPTNINRIEICIGGWGNTSYTSIKNIIASQGTGSNSILYRNFQALRNAIPEITAVNNDDESAYDVNSAVSFHVMMSDLGYKTTLAPYTNKSYWQSLATNINNSRSGAVDRVLIQCYDGGSGNNPSDWHLNNIPLHAGRLNYQDFGESKSKMQDWKNNSGVVGGFFWVYNDNTWNLNTYATAVNRIFSVKTTNSAKATFYSDASYSGYAIGLPIGSFTTADLAAYGITADDISSLKVSEGYKVTAYVDNNYSGTSYSYITDISNIGDNNDKMSSVTIYKNPGSVVATFFSNENYNGVGIGLSQGTFTAEDLASYGINNDDITSLKVNSGYRVIVYLDNNFSGTSMTYTSDQSNIGDSYNDKISSIKIFKSSDAAVATFYENINYAGSSVGLPLGTFTQSQIEEYGISDNSITSLKVNSGYKVIFYTDNNFGGTNVTYTSDQGWIGDYNDKVSSIKIFKSSDAVVATFYESIDYAGSSVGLPLGTFTQSQIEEYGISDNSITSLKVNSGYKVILYIDNDFGGTNVTYTSDQSWIGDYNDKVSSIMICPTFNADITDNKGTISASHASVGASESIDKVTDNIADTKFCANITAGAQVWLQYISPVPVLLQSYTLTSANDEQNRDPKSWKMQGSNNGTDWITIDTRSNEVFDARFLKKTYTVNTSNKNYTYFRLNVAELYLNTVTIFQLAEWQLFGDEIHSTEINQVDLQNVKIYPNPVGNHLSIKSPMIEGDYEYVIYSILGNQIGSGRILDASIDVHELESGVYNIVLTSKDEQIIRRFIKK